VSIAALQPYLLAFGLVLLRCSGMFLLIPTFGGETVPLRLRGAISIVMALTLTSLVGPVPMGDPISMILAAIGELLMGLAMGSAVRLVLSSAEMAGELGGMVMGLSFMQIVDPLTREPGGEISRLLGALAVMLLLAIDGHHIILSGMGASLQQAPVGTVLPRALYITTLLPLLGTVFSAALRIAAPVIVALLLTNGALGLLARAAPQLNLFVLSFGVMIGLGMLTLWTSVAPSLTVLTQHLRRMTDILAAMIGA
jgi:flagellar biosynthesis protein FliR